jgi:hypothetical protein
MIVKYRLLFLVMVLPLSVVASGGQATGQAMPSPSVSADRAAQSDDQHAASSIEEEMRAKREIRYAENEHKDNLERAREVSELGIKLAANFIAKKSLDREDAKRLDRLEKLAKQLRNKAGGKDSDEPLECPPVDLKTAVKRVVESSELLSKLVEKTPRQVVSATVIDEANVLLQLIKLTRQFSR